MERRERRRRGMKKKREGTESEGRGDYTYLNLSAVRWSANTPMYMRAGSMMRQRTRAMKCFARPP